MTCQPLSAGAEKERKEEMGRRERRGEELWLTQKVERIVYGITADIPKP